MVVAAWGAVVDVGFFLMCFVHILWMIDDDPIIDNKHPQICNIANIRSCRSLKPPFPSSPSVATSTSAVVVLLMLMLVVMEEFILKTRTFVVIPTLFFLPSNTQNNRCTFYSTALYGLHFWVWICFRHSMVWEVLYVASVAYYSCKSHNVRSLSLSLSLAYIHTGLPFFWQERSFIVVSFFYVLYYKTYMSRQEVWACWNNGCGFYVVIIAWLSGLSFSSVACFYELRGLQARANTKKGRRVSPV